RATQPLGGARGFSRASAPRFDGRARFAIDFALLDRLALVVVLLPFREADRHLDAAVLEVQPHRDEGHALLHRLPNQLADLVATKEQLAAAQRLVVRVTAMAVRADVHV